MLKYQIYQSHLEGTSAYSKYYCCIVSDETLNLDALAKHMKDHYSPYSKGMVRGILTDAVRCIRELLLQGKRIQLYDLASFDLAIEHSKGAVLESNHGFVACLKKKNLVNHNNRSSYKRKGS